MFVSSSSKQSLNFNKTKQFQTEFYDENSSSSDDDYPYEFANSDSNSSDSDDIRPKNRCTNIVFVNGRKINPKTSANDTLGRQNEGKNSAKLNGPKSPRKIRFADGDDDEKGSSPVVMATKNVTLNGERKRTTVTIRNEGWKQSRDIRSTMKVTSVEQESRDDRTERLRVENGPKAKIRIQNGTRRDTMNTDHVIINSRNGEGVKKGFREMKRVDSGISRGSSSSVSQDASDSFEKDEYKKPDIHKFAQNQEKKKDERKIEKCYDGQDSLKTQQDSGIEDIGRMLPGMVSERGHVKTRLSKSSETFDSGNYSNVLRQASLRVFGLVGRRTKDEAVLKESSRDCGKGASITHARTEGSPKGLKSETQHEIQDKTIFLKRLNELYNRPLIDEKRAQENDDDRLRKAATAGEDEEEDWPEPPTFDDEIEEKDEIEEQGTFEKGPTHLEGTLLAQVTQERQTGAKLQCKEGEVCYTANVQGNGELNGDRLNNGTKNFQETLCGSKAEFQEPVCLEIEGNRKQINVKRRDNNEMLTYDDGSFGKSSEGSSPGVEMKKVSSEKSVEKNGKDDDDDDCSICEIFNKEQRFPKKSSDMEKFRKTALNDCDNVLKKLRHAQKIARKMSGGESPRRGMTWRSTQSIIADDVPCAHGPVITSQSQMESNVRESASSAGTERKYHNDGVITGPASVAKEKDETMVRFDNSSIKEIQQPKRNAADNKSNANVTVKADVYAAARQHCKDLIDAGGYLISNSSKKERPKVKRNLSEDFLVVDAMPCSQRKGPGNYNNAPMQPLPDARYVWHNLEPRYGSEHVHTMEAVRHLEPRFNGRHDNHYLHSSDPRFRTFPHPEQQYNGNRVSPIRGSLVHESHSSPRMNPSMQSNTPPWWSQQMHHSNDARYTSPNGGQYTSSTSSHPQQNSDGKSKFDPFRAEREKSWFKKAARRLRRSLSFEDNEKKHADKVRAPAEAQLKQCNSSGNIKAEYDSYLARETRGRSYSDEGLRRGISQAAKRSLRQSMHERINGHLDDPNYQGYIIQNEAQQTNRMTSPLYYDVNGNEQVFREIPNTTVPRNLYFGNNPPALSQQGFKLESGLNGVDYKGSHFGEIVVAPLEVKKSTHKKATTKFLQSKK